MLTIYSLNANGLRQFDKMKQVFTTCDINKWDILCLQETFWDDTFMTDVCKLWDGKVYYNNYDLQNRKGVAILLKKDINAKVVNVSYGDKGRLLKITIEQFDKLINVFSIYAPNEYQERKLFFENSKKFIDDDAINILGGDYNDYSNVLLDRSNTMSNILPNNKSFTDFKTKSNLIDIWRDRNPEKRIFSRKQWVNGVLKQSRIDSFLVSRNCMSNTSYCFYKISSVSDHNFVCIRFDFSDIDRGPGMWIFNNTLLRDEYFCTRIYNIIHEYIQCPLYEREKIVWWDNLKYKLKCFAKYYAREKQNREKQKFWQIHNKLQHEYSRIDKGFNVNHETVMQLELELRDYEKQKCEGAILRSKAFWALQSDRNTEYFLKLEKYKQESNCIKELYTSEGTTVTETMRILETEVEFYKKLYHNEPVDTDMQQILFKQIHERLNEGEKEMCEKNITMNDLTESLQSMNKNKSPGFDGLTVEFYQKFWNVLGPLFKEVSEEIYKCGELSNTMKRGIISLIYKKKGDKKLLKNWRPITLLNVDYKIISKTLASRLKMVLDTIISPEQTCSVPGRDISDNIASIRDIIEYADMENIPAYILKLDAEKAFDRVSHEYLFNLLPQFGFGDIFIKWVRILYTDISSAIKCNGHISSFFDIKRSVRQGCGLSALLYVLSAEPLNLLLKQNYVNGISIKDSNITSLIYQHADDTTLTLADKNSISKSFQLLDVYCKASGARVNVEKSEMMVINDTIDSVTQLQLPFIVKTDCLEILGITLGNNKELCENINWKPKIDKIRNILQIWRQRHLTLRGKAIVIQSLLMSRIWYLLNVQPLPDWVEREVKKHCLNFLWNNKPPQIKYTTIIGKECEGGLNIPDIRMRCYSFRLKWLRKYFDTSVNAIWKHTMDYFISKYQNLGLTHEIFAIVYDKASLVRVPVYYRELLHSWNVITKDEREKSLALEDIYNQPIFSNTHIVARNKLLYFRVFIESNITKIGHITNVSERGFADKEIIYDKIQLFFPGYSKQKIEELYHIVLCSIPKQWTDMILKKHCIPNDITIPNVVVNENKSISASYFTAKICYDILRKHIFKEATSTIFIESFGLAPNDTFWKLIFNRFKNPNMVDLDFKIAHNIVWTNEKLHRIKKTDTNVCPVCKTEIEDELHMFVECDELASFQDLIKDVLIYFFKDKGYTENDFYKWFLYGISGMKKHNGFINLFLSTARCAIYRRRCYMTLKNKLLSCTYIFENTFQRNLLYLYNQYSEDFFEKTFVRNNPFVTTQNGKIRVTWN